MRRGLMAWDATEVPVTTIEARQANLRAAMQEQGLGAMLAYTNIARPAAVSWMSGFTPYWSEGIYCLPLEGKPVFATALSNRVAQWITTVMAVGEVKPTPAPGAVLGKLLAESGVSKAGILELDDLPAKQATALMQNAPDINFVDATSLFNPIRAVVDDTERALVKRAATLAAECMDKVNPDAATAQELIAPCELHARLSGAEEIFIAVAPDLARDSSLRRTDTASALGDTFALRLSIAYKGAWVRLTRSFSNASRGAADFDRLQQIFDSYTPNAGTSVDGMLKQLFADNGAKVSNWQIEQPRGGYPLTIVAGSDVTNTITQGAPAVLSVDVTMANNHWLAARPIF